MTTIDDASNVSGSLLLLRHFLLSGRVFDSASSLTSVFFFVSLQWLATHSWDFEFQDV